MVKNPNTFPWKSGPRQGYSVLSLLFDIVLEGLASVIGQEKESDLVVYICRVRKAWIFLSWRSGNVCVWTLVPFKIREILASSLIVFFFFFLKVAEVKVEEEKGGGGTVGESGTLAVGKAWLLCGFRQHGNHTRFSIQRYFLFLSCLKSRKLSRKTESERTNAFREKNRIYEVDYTTGISVWTILLLFSILFNHIYPMMQALLSPHFTSKP